VRCQQHAPPRRPPCAPPPPPRSRAGSTLAAPYPADLGSDNSCSTVGDTIYVFGGYTPDYTAALNTIYAFTPATGVWTKQKATLAQGRGVARDGADAELVGELGSGFKQMAEMLNLSRLWNAICSVAIMRRAIHEATEYLRLRKTFGKPAIQHALVRQTLADLNAEEIASKHLVFKLAQLLDRGDAGDETSKALVRILTPLAKYWTAKDSVVGLVSNPIVFFTESRRTLCFCTDSAPRCSMGLDAVRGLSLAVDVVCVMGDRCPNDDPYASSSDV
jgi:hypothetical protein